MGAMNKNKIFESYSSKFLRYDYLKIEPALFKLTFIALSIFRGLDLQMEMMYITTN